MDQNPCLRVDLQPVPVEVDGERLIALRDPEELQADTVLVPPTALPVLEYFDGTHALDEISDDLLRRGAGTVDADSIRALAQSLDNAYLLDNERSIDALVERTEAFEREPVRAARHAGDAYPDTAEEARAFLQEMLDSVDAGQAPRPSLKRLIAPHIDLRLGGKIHAHAHHRLRAGGRPDVVIVLGVCHAASESRFILCPKDFATPLGTVPCDEAIAAALSERLGDELTREQVLHRNEHSVEFQALWLAHLWPDDPPAIVPLLVGSFHDLVDEGRSPRLDVGVEAFITALRETIQADPRRVVVIASVDFAHMGPQYGHENGLDEAAERELEEFDAAVLKHVIEGNAEAFYESLAADRNAHNVCGLAPVYVTLRLNDGPGELLRYGQGRIDPESGSVVSYAAAAFAD